MSSVKIRSSEAGVGGITGVLIRRRPGEARHAGRVTSDDKVEIGEMEPKDGQQVTEFSYRPQREDNLANTLTLDFYPSEW